MSNGKDTKALFAGGHFDRFRQARLVGDPERSESLTSSNFTDPGVGTPARFCARRSRAEGAWNCARKDWP
jgi:hypothetical protein